MIVLIRSLAGAILVTSLLIAGWLIIAPGPVLPGLGLGLAAAAPLSFMIRNWHVHQGGKEHPVTISALSGLGCVMVMATVQRFGNQYQWVLLIALTALAAWMVWQRRVWRCGADHQSSD